MNLENLFIPFNQIFSKLRSGTNSGYNFGYDVINASTQFNQLHNEQQKLAAVLSNPALLKIAALQCDLFSLGKVYVYDLQDNELSDDPFLKFINQPNPMQTYSQFMWDYMFWQMMGTDYTYVHSAVVDNPLNVMYHLHPFKMEWPYEFEKAKDKLIFNPNLLKEYGNKTIRYRYDDGTSEQLNVSRILSTTDLTNGVGNWWKGASRIDALYKIISNSEFTLDAKNINIRYSGKFLVGANNDTTRLGMGEDEKKDLEDKIDTNVKKVWAYKVPVKIQRFVENYANLQLDQAYLHDYFLIGSMFNIPRDVLEAYNSSTYENQEKARVAHINYCFEPKGNAFMNAFEKYFGYNEQGKKLCMSWDHLPFMQSFEKERFDVKAEKIKTMQEMMAMGISVDQINSFLDLDFKIEPNESGQSQTQGSATGQNQGAI